MNRDPIKGRIYPTLEVHRSTKEVEESKKTGCGLICGFEWGKGTSDSTSKMFFADGKVDVTRLITRGLEDYDKLPIKTKINGETVLGAATVDTTAGFARANLELTPFREVSRELR